MCGIVGIVNSNSRAASREVLERMNQCIVHRGPDEDGFYVGGSVALAMRRLSIIDLAGGQQPIFNRDRTKAIVFNGEIYNFQELRRDLEARGHEFYTSSDTEIIVHLYDRYGADCVEHLRGMFAFAIWDTKDDSLFIARDRVGKKPLLYSHQPNGDLIFGSEFRALLAHPDVSRAVDYEAIDNYLSYLCIPAPQTAFKQIRKLEPAHWLRWKDGRVETKRYWMPDFSKKIKISGEEAEVETLRILRESTKLRMISEVPLGAFLSGGVDSSAVVALMAEASAQPVKTFSIGFEEQDYSELKYARLVAEHVGAEYNEFIVRPNALEVLPTLVEHYGEPYADSSAIATYYVAKETRKFVTVALNGDGGDESFAGYERYAAMRIAENYYKIPALLRKTIFENAVDLIPASDARHSRARDLKRFVKAAALPKTERYFRWVSALDRQAKAELYTEDFKNDTLNFDASATIGQWLGKTNGLGILDATLLTDQMTYLPNDLLVKVDIASMAVSLEARSPLLDHKVIEFAASLPENIKMKRFETKSLLKKVAARLVPKEVIYRRKMGFGVPIGNWFRGEMKDFVRDVLLSEKSMRRNIIKPEVLKKYIDEHIDGKSDYTHQIYTLLMLELWFQRFID
ncbi:MAG TPA: asparagine synthase (glutamine-hydrolyzing) [Pyrinomonadaceae bacterium]|nr:asparagine synthase (glutamine-hydrolyzing) [Pyrinomonadaceae bacterium]